MTIIECYLPYTGQPVLEVGRTGRFITSGTKPREAGESSERRNRKKKRWKLLSTSESVSDWTPLKHAMTTRSTHKTS